MSDDFHHQYAIRMPSGALYAERATAVVEDYSISSPMRDMALMMGLGSAPERRPVGPALPAIYDDRKAAERKLVELQAIAERVGVDAWGGTVVERLCTPFTSGDPSVEFAAEIQKWLADNGGEA